MTVDAGRVPRVQSRAESDSPQSCAWPEIKHPRDAAYAPLPTFLSKARPTGLPVPFWPVNDLSHSQKLLQQQTSDWEWNNTLSCSIPWAGYSSHLAAKSLALTVLRTLHWCLLNSWLNRLFKKNYEYWCTKSLAIWKPNSKFYMWKPKCEESKIMEEMSYFMGVSNSKQYSGDLNLFSWFLANFNVRALNMVLFNSVVLELARPAKSSKCLLRPYLVVIWRSLCA